MNSPETILKIAAEEIKEVLRKHDLAGAVALHTPGHGEYFVHLNPSYSCAYMYNDDQVRFYCKASDFKTKQLQIQKMADTSNMLMILTQITAFNFGALHPLSEKFDKETNAEHY